MRRVHIVGRKNHGKTTLLVELIRCMTRRGLNVGTIKHTSHCHELDTPGKDSYRLREAGVPGNGSGSASGGPSGGASGGAPAGIVTPDLLAVYVPRASEQDPYAQLAPLFENCDWLLIEGDLDAAAPKVEVWRAEHGADPLAASRRDITAVITDDPLSVSVPVWPRRDVEHVADELLAVIG